MDERPGGSPVTDAGCPQCRRDEILQSAALERLAAGVDEERAAAADAFRLRRRPARSGGHYSVACRGGAGTLRARRPIG